jgi:membrane protein
MLKLIPMRFPGHGMSMRQFLRKLRVEWREDRASDTAGALTFYGVLALFPFVLFLVSLASLLIDPLQAEQLIDSLGRVAPPQVTQILGDRLRELAAGEDAGLVTFGIIAAIWAASGGVMALIRALNIAYDVEEGRSGWKVRLLAIGATLLFAGLSLAAALLIVAMPPLAERIGGPIGTALIWLRLPVAGAVMLFVWALMYWLLPDVEQRFKFITPGTLIGVGVWLLASWGFSVYVQNFGKYEATYGALGGVIVLLLWMWISGQVILLGAEINKIIEHASPEGKRPGAKSKHDTGTEEATFH